jgi:hypothetical protein
MIGIIAFVYAIGPVTFKTASFPTPTLLENGVDRASKSELSLIVQGYIIPDTVNVAKAGPSPKSYNVTKTSFTEKVV